MFKPLFEQKFVGLLLRYGSRIRAFVSTLLPLSDDIDEVVQEACLVAWKKMGEFRYTADEPDEEFLRWICSIARLEALAYIRKHKSRVTLIDETLLEKLVSLQIDQQDYYCKLQPVLATCLEKLKPRDKFLIKERYMEGMSAEALAKKVNRSVSAVYKSVARIRNILLLCIHRSIQNENS